MTQQILMDLDLDPDLNLAQVQPLAQTTPKASRSRMAATWYGLPHPANLCYCQALFLSCINIWSSYLLQYDQHVVLMYLEYANVAQQ